MNIILFTAILIIQWWVGYVWLQEAGLFGPFDLIEEPDERPQ